jgi:hypothetical protein
MAGAWGSLGWPVGADLQESDEARPEQRLSATAGRDEAAVRVIARICQRPGYAELSNLVSTRGFRSEQGFVSRVLLQAFAARG